MKTKHRTAAKQKRKWTADPMSNVKSMTTEQIMALADAYADKLFNQGLHQRCIDDAPEEARATLQSAVEGLFDRLSDGASDSMNDKGIEAGKQMGL